MAERTHRTRKPQQERSRITRERLLEAAIDCLAERGWSGTTMSVVAERAGVSRGASQHHFRTREELVTAAVAYVTEKRLAEVQRHTAEHTPRERRVEAVVQMLADFYTSRIFNAALQLWIAASSDPALKAHVLPLEAKVGREAHRAAVALLGADERRPGVREAVQATLDLMRGLGIANLLTDDSARRRRLVKQWARMLDAVLADDAQP
jgi:AcrR family transcriptional regulator